MNAPAQQTHPNRLMLQRHLAAENAHDMAATLATVHPDCIFRDLAIRQEFHGHAGAERHYRQWWTAFGNVVERSPIGGAHWIDDETYVAEPQYTGRHIGDFLGLAPTGRPFVLPFTVFVKFRDGLFVEERFYYDLATLMRQLGETRIDPEALQQAQDWAAGKRN
ncbi:MAG: ester cyclase [Ferrovibrio sp.]|uniref:ester cyclase n=1 Tax=Ferrovibrio sp. TaxID=1917215 RepID=UPI00261EEA91|nr:ester cyclase [Ferrovibrio sp.]MCW0233170.1 ester cyclase [Ferrovibrio sp.]